MLGAYIQKTAADMSIPVLPLSHGDLDITDRDKVLKFFESNDFDGLINCAGWTRVDDCEDPAVFSKAMVVNGAGPGYLAQACKRTGRWLVHFSTDYVFDGQKQGLYSEAEAPHPINAYGRTKLEGENKILGSGVDFFIIRTSWLYGAGGVNFVKTIAGLLRTQRSIQVVSDQVGGPTYAGDLAGFALELVLRKAPTGIYHFANTGRASWYDFAKKIEALTGSEDCVIEPVLSLDFPRKAARPANSCFDLSKASKAVGREPRHWQEALKYFLTEEFA